jgi:flagellar hook-associated protein 2
MSNGLRITGMASGLDTETLVKQMMKPFTMKVDKMKQDRQIATWKQELYRDILSDTATMTNTYFNVLKSDTNMLSKNNYAGFDVTATNNIVAESAGVSATASVGAQTGSYKVEVTDLATAAKVPGTSINESSNSFVGANWQNKTIMFEIGGVQKSITTNDVVPTRAELILDIKAKLAAKTELAGKITVSEGAGAGIKFNALTNDSVKVVSTTVSAEMDNLTGKVINPNKYTTKLSDLGIVAGGTLTFNYNDANGVSKTSVIKIVQTATPDELKADPTIFQLQDATISQLMDKINQGTSGAVKLNFSGLTNQFNIESLQTGSLASLNVTESVGADILTKLNLPLGATTGMDAKVIITPPGSTVGITVVKPGNSFSIDEVNYTLTNKGITNITITGNTQKTYDKIKGFIDKYNELVEKVSQKTDEKKQYKYVPLSDEQKKDMKEDEIKQWESKAKEGLLKGDSNLQNMLNSMRSAFYEDVEGVGISLSEIGLSTSADTSKRGKIIIDEKKLKTAIETKGEQVANLFTKDSITHSSYSPNYTADERTRRNKEEGIFERINDILQDYTRTTIRNANGKRGILFEKAGIKGDEYVSLLSEDIIKKDGKINEMIKNLSARENKYYLQFSKLEVAMNKLNSQSSWLTQQLGGGQ